MPENAPDGFITLFNPESGDPWACPADAVADHLAKGWLKSAPTKNAAPAAKER